MSQYVYLFSFGFLSENNHKILNTISYLIFISQIKGLVISKINLFKKDRIRILKN